jgi:hypothetical protein
MNDEWNRPLTLMDDLAGAFGITPMPRPWQNSKSREISLELMTKHSCPLTMTSSIPLIESTLHKQLKYNFNLKYDVLERLSLAAGDLNTLLTKGIQDRGME